MRDLSRHPRRGRRTPQGASISRRQLRKRALAAPGADPSARGETINDVSRDVSHAEVSDRRLWLAERCPSCGAQPGVRCRERSRARRTPPARLALHAARGWRLRPCPACKAKPGEGCFTPRGRPAARPHTARLHLARGELHAAEEDVWRALERSGAQLALVRFSGGGGRQRERSRASVSRPRVASLPAGGARARPSSPTRSQPQCGAATAPSAASRRSPQRSSGMSRIGRLLLAGNARDRALRRDPPGREGNRRLSRPVRARHVARYVAGRARRPRVLPLRPADPSWCSPGGALLLKALPAGRLTGEAARALRPLGARAARALRPLRWPDAGRGAARGALLLKALPAGRLARAARARTRGEGGAARARRPSQASSPTSNKARA